MYQPIYPPILSQERQLKKHEQVIPEHGKLYTWFAPYLEKESSLNTTMNTKINVFSKCDICKGLIIPGYCCLKK
jgi:hypothetical protein